jgi:signal transduction histidine kinase/ligand-binding sensor domain-containing protein
VTKKGEIGTVAAGLLFLAAFANQVFALDPGRPFSSYLKTHFTHEDGLPTSIVQYMVQSRDGFLWLVSNGLALARFDGRHFTPFDQSGHVRTLALAPNGDLWVATRDDLERIPAAALNQFGNLPSIAYHPRMAENDRINCLRFSRSGALWVGTDTGLYRFEGGAFSPVIPGPAISRIEEASNGHLFVISSEGFIEWDGLRAVRHPEIAAQLDVEADKVFDVMEDSHGVTWFCTTKGVARRVGGSIEKLAPYGLEGRGALRAYEDPQGNVWIAQADGLYRATASGSELAVPGISVNYVYGDRDGDLWVATNGDGLYRFKDRPIRIFTTSDGLPSKVVMTALVTADGELWTGANCGGISRFDGRRFQTYNEKDGLLNSCVWALAEDTNRDLWIGTYGGGAFRFRNGRFTQFSKPQGFPSDIVKGVLVGSDQSVWFATRGGLTRMRNGQIRTYTVADGLSSNVTVRLFQDRDGVLWVGTIQGFDRMDGDRFVHVLPLPKGAVIPLGEDRPGGIYINVEPGGGVFRVDKNMAAIPMGWNLGLEPSGMARTEQGDLWFSGDAIFRVSANALGQLRGPDEPLDYAVFGVADGLPPSTECPPGHPNSTLDRNGKLWFATTQGLAMIDLPRLPKTDRKPAIYVEEVTVGRNSQFPGHELLLPSGTHHVDLQFDAIEISSPERIRLQYRLDSVDSEWLDAGRPAHATYSNIPPGIHSFHIRACNRDGIWDRSGIVYGITQQPFFYETGAFRLAGIAIGILLLAALFRLRLRQAMARINARLEERLAERERIARELHDTLLQGFHGLILHFEVAAGRIPESEPARQMMEAALDRADQVMAEGRDRVMGLRASNPETIGLAQSIVSAGEEIARGSGVEISVIMEGGAQNLNPAVHEETHWIAREALANAVHHSKGREIEVEIAYGPRELRVRFRDDGLGISQEILRGGRPGHWGLSGMRERAQKMGARISIGSRPGAGTEIELTVPARLAYRGRYGRSLWSWLRHIAIGGR